jgi:N-acetylmuramoyl-L-alanine amidase
VLDLADVAFQLPSTAGRQGKGAVSGFRYGLMSAGQSRVMLDLARPVRVEAAEWKSDAAGGASLVLRLAPTDAATFEREASLPLPDKPPEPAQEAVPSAPAEGKSRKRPVIVIDAGHGGIDPGAIGATDITEKSIVLAVAQQVRAMLPSQRYSVVMTRTEDVYVGLDARLAVSQRAEADLFISIHADAIDARFAQSVRRASIYTLSERASNEEARLLAEKENAADSVAGLASVPDAERDNVKGILIDLMKRETANFSSEFSRLLVGRLGNALSLARDPQRSAAFKVLKQTQSPSVLIELGYMTNAEDERQMRTPEWQRKVAIAIAGAIEAYFAKRTAGAP